MILQTTRNAIARLLVLSTFLLGTQGAVASPFVYTQTIHFPTIQERQLLAGTEGIYSVPSFSSISLVRMLFTSTDPDFNGGFGPTGGQSGVEIALIDPAKSPTRFGIASVVPGNQVVSLFPGSGDPLQRFEEAVHLIDTGMLTVSLGSFENFPGCCSFGFPLDQPSSLTLEVTGNLSVSAVPEPSTLSLFFLGGIGALVASRRLRARSPLQPIHAEGL